MKSMRLRCVIILFFATFFVYAAHTIVPSSTHFLATLCESPFFVFADQFGLEMCPLLWIGRGNGYVYPMTCSHSAYLIYLLSRTAIV